MQGSRVYRRRVSLVWVWVGMTVGGEVELGWTEVDRGGRVLSSVSASASVSASVSVSSSPSSGWRWLLYYYSTRPCMV